MNGLTYGWINGLTYGQMNGLTDGQMNGLTDGQMNGLTDGQMNGLTDGQMNGLTDGDRVHSSWPPCEARIDDVFDFRCYLWGRKRLAMLNSYILRHVIMQHNTIQYII